MKLPKTILVKGKKWFDQRYGNTYFSAKVYVDGVDEVLNLEPQYGYGDQYLQESIAALIKAEILPARCKSTYQIREHGIRLEYDAVNVAKEKDL